MTKKQMTLVTIGLLMGVLLEALDGTIVSTAVPHVVADLGELNLLSWVFAAYIITSTVSTPLYGKLSDMYGRMPFYLGGMILFMLGTIASGASQNMTQLVIFRGIQGLGSGAMLPIAIAMISTVFPPENRGSLQAALSGAFGLASLVGPTLGGWIVDQFSWRWVFYFSVPFGILGVILLYTNLPETARRSTVEHGKQSIDYLGAVLLIVFTTALLLGFQWGSDVSLGWTHWQTLTAFLLATLCFIGFILVERRVADPLIPFHLFRDRTFTFTMCSNFLIGATMFAFLSYIPLFLQAVLGTTATASGNLITPANMTLVVGSFLPGVLLGKRVHYYKWMALLATSLMFAAACLLATLSSASTPWQVLFYMIPFGFGLGMTFSIYAIITSALVEKRFLGLSLGLITFFRNLGGAISVALFGSLLNIRLNTEIPAQFAAHIPARILPNLPINKIVAAGTNVLTNETAMNALHTTVNAFDPTGHLYVAIIAALRSALADSLHTIFIGGTIVALLTLLATFGLKNTRIDFTNRGQNRAEETAPAENAVV